MYDFVTVLELRPNDSIRPEALYREYQEYARENGDYCRRSSEFSQAMERAGYRKTVRNGKRFWWGVSIDLESRYATGSGAAYTG